MPSQLVFQPACCPNCGSGNHEYCEIWKSSHAKFEAINSQGLCYRVDILTEAPSPSDMQYAADYQLGAHLCFMGHAWRCEMHISGRKEWVRVLPPSAGDGEGDEPQFGTGPGVAATAAVVERNAAPCNGMTAAQLASAARKEAPMATGLLDYFPDALEAVSRLSKKGNDKHNPGEPLHWTREKSTDHANCIMRHMMGRGTWDDDNDCLHDVAVAWRALAQAQLAIEKWRKKQG